MQSPQDPLAELRDIHLPPPVEWWPPAIGWWLILILSVALTIFVWRRIRAYLRGVRRFAMHELNGIEESRASNPGNVAIAIQLSELLRRVAISRYPRADVASLTGEPWAAFLVEHSNNEFVDEFLLLEMVAYAPHSEFEERIDVDRLMSATRVWIKRNAA